MSISDATLAEFARVALSLDLIAIENVIAWADDIILKSDEPPYWAIELAEATEFTVYGVLKHVPGASDSTVIFTLVLALLYRNWSAGKLSWQEVGSVAGDLRTTFSLPKGVELALIRMCDGLDSDEYDLVKMVRLPPTDTDATIARDSGAYAVYQRSLPSRT